MKKEQLQTLLDLFKNTLNLARIKWGNLDADANQVLEAAGAAIAEAEQCVARDRATLMLPASMELPEGWSKTEDGKLLPPAGWVATAYSTLLANRPKQERIEESAWQVAEKVRTDLDQVSCPGVYLNLAVESVVKHFVLAQQELIESSESLVSPKVCPDAVTRCKAFEDFVRAELGDIAVYDNGRYISPKIGNYFKVWEAAVIDTESVKPELPHRLARAA